MSGAIQGSRSEARARGFARGGPDAGPEAASRIESLGAALPERRMTTVELMARCRAPVLGLDLEKLTGVRERRVCSEGEDSVSLAVAAALDCLSSSSHRAADLEMVVSCSITRFRGGLSMGYEPPISLLVANAIGARGALHFDITNACAGMMTGLLVLDDFIRRGVVRRGMVVSGECITNLSLNASREMRTPASRQMASLTLGDAGSAFILERADGEARDRVEATELVTMARFDRLCVATPCATGPGGVMRTKPRKLHRVAIENSVPVIAAALERVGLSADDIDLYVPHQTSIRAIYAGHKHIERGLGVRSGERNIAITLPSYGNTASTAIFLALRDMLREGRVQRGDRVMLMCFASGLVVGASILTLDRLVERHGNSH